MQSEPLWHAYRATLEGRFEVGDALLSELALSGDEGARAQIAALTSLRWLVDPDRGRLVPLHQLAKLGGSGTFAWSLAAACGARGAVLELDQPGLESWGKALAALKPAPKNAAVVALHRATSMWCDYAAGRPESVLKRELPAGAEPWLEVEADAVRALAHADLGNVDEGLALARSASTQARGVSFVYAKVLAQLALGRLRRLTGHPLLEAHIVRETQAHAPRSWQPWIQWELFFAGSTDDASEGGRHVHVAQALRAKSAEAFRAAKVGCSTQGWKPHLGEQTMLVEALDAAGAPSASMQPWVYGRRPQVPAAVAALRSAQSEIPHGMVLAGPGRRARRIFAAAVERSAARVIDVPKRSVRSSTLLAVLSLDGGKTSLEDCFRQVYGFGYDASAHAGLFRVLLHRTRKLIGDAGEVERDAEGLAVRWREDVCFADPRGEEPLESLVLRFLANRKSGQAKEAAANLEIPLRTVQGALRQLADEGVLEVERNGKHLVYSFEDTCFSPTQVFGPSD